MLEIRDTRYTHAYGGARVTRSDVLDIDPQNRDATIVADLAGEESLPAQRFDCAIVTQTLQFVPRPGVAVANLWRSLAPGGVVLTSLAFLIGAAEVDLRRAELSFEDEDFPLVACARARKLA